MVVGYKTVIPDDQTLMLKLQKCQFRLKTFLITFRKCPLVCCDECTCHTSVCDTADTTRDKKVMTENERGTKRVTSTNQEAPWC